MSYLLWKASDGRLELVELESEDFNLIDDEGQAWLTNPSGMVSVNVFVDAIRDTELAASEVEQLKADETGQGGPPAGPRAEAHIEKEWDYEGKILRRLYLRDEVRDEEAKARREERLASEQKKSRGRDRSKDKNNK